MSVWGSEQRPGNLFLRERERERERETLDVLEGLQHSMIIHQYYMYQRFDFVHIQIYKKSIREKLLRLLREYIPIKAKCNANAKLIFILTILIVVEKRLSIMAL